MVKIRGIAAPKERGSIKKHVERVVCTLFAFLFASSSALGAADNGTGGACGFAPRLPAFFAPRQGCALYIDLDACTMTVYVDGERYGEFPVSGGKPSTPSPVGVWKVTGTSNWGGAFGGSWIGLNVPWGLFGIHGTRAPWSIGAYNVSHGCIRMRDKDVRIVRGLVSPGSTVYIKQASIPFRALKNGMFGSDVYFAQQMLQDRGHYTGALDGKFGNRLEAAVKSFQSANGLKADGVVSFETYKKLLELRE